MISACLHPPVALRRLLLGVFATLIAWASLMPMPRVEADIPKNIQAYDLPFHVLVYLALTASAIWAFARRETHHRDRLNLFLACTLYGAVLEILQAVLPGIHRSCTVSDFLSNMAGAALAAAMFPLRLLPPTPDPTPPCP